MSTRAFITGVSGTELTAAERAFVRAEIARGAMPFGLSFEISLQVAAPLWELTARRSTDPAGLSIPVDGAAERVHLATTSATMIAQVIRSAIGFQGLLTSNDGPGKALVGSIGERSRARSRAGTPLHSNDNAELDALTPNTASA
ncbi:hypothetical protein SAMN05216525_11235 [Bradyrhizobium sp. Gha]|nr:hypothetical protein SAMN05216525_11235 [Bradyrhizobium sp. Gha]